MNKDSVSQLEIWILGVLVMLRLSVFLSLLYVLSCELPCLRNPHHHFAPEVLHIHILPLRFRHQDCIRRQLGVPTVHQIER